LSNGNNGYNGNDHGLVAQDGKGKQKKVELSLLPKGHAATATSNFHILNKEFTGSDGQKYRGPVRAHLDAQEEMWRQRRQDEIVLAVIDEDAYLAIVASEQSLAERSLQ